MNRLTEAEIGRLADAMLGDARAATAARATPRWRSVGVVVTAAAALSAVTFFMFAKISAHEGPPTGSSLAMRNINTPAVTALALCIMGAPVAGQSAAVQWRVEDGGNGHWYRATQSLSGVTWVGASASSANLGGHLASPLTLAEDNFVWQLAGQSQFWNGSMGPWLGGRQISGAGEPDGGWSWQSGEPWVGWVSGSPDNGCGALNENSIHYFSPTGLMPLQLWNDMVGEATCGPYPLPIAYIVEWSADCNSDGIVDYGQILSGQFVDANSNGVPDICEIDPCPGDVVQTGAVDAVDLAAMLAAWGTDGGVYPRADINHDGIVAGSDLGSLLSGWGACQ